MIFFSTAIFHVSNVDAFIYLYFVFVRRTVGCAADHVRLLFGRVSVTCSCLIYYIEMILQCADAPRPRQLSTILLQYHFRIKNDSFSIPSDFLQLQATSQNIGTWRFSASNHDFHKYPHLFYSLDRTAFVYIFQLGRAPNASSTRLLNRCKWNGKLIGALWAIESITQFSIKCKHRKSFTGYCLRAWQPCEISFLISNQFASIDCFLLRFLSL